MPLKLFDKNRPDDEKHPYENFYKSSNPDEILEEAERVMASNACDSDLKSVAEVAYIQLGIINPLAEEFMEAAGIKERLK